MKALGPGLLESAYVKCLIDELKLRNLKVEHEKSLPIFNRGLLLNFNVMMLKDRKRGGEKQRVA